LKKGEGKRIYGTREREREKRDEKGKRRREK